MTTTADLRISMGFQRGAGKRAISASKKWKVCSAAVQEYAQQDDAWAYIVDKFPTERAIRWRYDMVERKFFSDEVSVKIDNESFAHGAMRECFKAKKLSKFAGKNPMEDWHLPFANVVAKKYFNSSNRQAYFDDVQLQMDAKVWSEDYNRAGPPKKIDIMQMMIIELPDRADTPIFHVESVIEGEYVKYNSNSGFVESNSEHSCRNTPQAFSHFTFEASGHKCMVVDVQGVGDLYTDPQIHTYDGEGYGSGNLATKGIALFFNTHRCNVICNDLGLSPFDLTKKERKRTDTVGDGVTVLRKSSHGSLDGDELSPISEKDDVFRDRGRSDSGIENSVNREDEEQLPKIRLPSSSLSAGQDHTEKPWDSAEIARSRLYNSQNRRPSCVVGATVNRDKLVRSNSGDARCPLNTKEERATILGQIHFDLAQYHYMGRFEEERVQDSASTLFHLRKAADCGLSVAEFTLACLQLNLYHDELKELELNPEDVSEAEGAMYLERAAKHGNLTAVLAVAQAYYGGSYSVTADWVKAEKYYRKYMDCTSSTDEMATLEPGYQILAKIAEMYQHGGNGMEKDPLKSGYLYTEAAEGAMGAMNGRMANKWFMLAEEVWAECEEE